MGLDAYVFCDCYEKGQLLEPPPAGITPRLHRDGSVVGDEDSRPVEVQMAFDQWRAERACAHRGGVLLHHRLGNVALIALLRAELSRDSKNFPMLLEKVLYNGIHAGDYLPVEILPTLAAEVARLGDFRCKRSGITRIMQRRWPRFGSSGWMQLPSAKADAFVQGFRMQLEELIAAAERVGKPIAF